jgi:hypothetical protein
MGASFSPVVKAVEAVQSGNFKLQNIVEQP